MTNSKQPDEMKFHRIIRDDLKKGGFKNTIRRDFDELKEFFLDDEKKNRLKDMGWFRRWMYTIGWLFKALFLKLTPVRRILLVVAILFMLMSRDVMDVGNDVTIRVNFGIISCIIMLFILMLELKDKLLAREELEAGRAIQLELMPEKSPIVPGWSLWLYERTANDVCGDLVDFQALDKPRYRIALADVAGKGLKAALLSVKLQSTLRALSPENLSLGVLASKVNKIFHRDSIRSMFASLVYVELRSDSNSITLLNAGHFPPLIRRGTNVEELGKGDPGIGIFPELSYTEKSIVLNHGDMMVIYSDGLIDAKNPAGEFYGSQRFIQSLSTSSQKDAITVGEMIIRELENYVRDARVYDDISLAVIMRT
jgi:sigma-B regulation protein RsbU (phosphoserine phosphatase)